MKDSRLIFWDFDGVIKETVDVKGMAFVELFEGYDTSLKSAIMKHHRENGGIDRATKIALYLEWAGESVTTEKVALLCKKFSEKVFNQIIGASWVPGAKEYIASNHFNQKFILISATPIIELNMLLNALEIEHYFLGVYGSPTKKAEAVRYVIDNLKINVSDCLYIGDSKVDYDAACSNNIQFLLRRHRGNLEEFIDYKGSEIADFSNYAQ